MFDFENPVMEEEGEILEETAPDWLDEEWDKVCDDPKHQAEGERRAAKTAALENDREQMFNNFYAKSYRRRKERIQISALRYAGLALCCGVLTYICGTHGLSWLAWILGIAGGTLAVISSYGFGVAHGMGK